MRDQKRFLIYILLFLFLSFYSLDRVTMAVAGSSVAKEMGLSPVSLGYLFSSYLWLYAFVLLPAGAVTDRLGARRTSALAATFWSLCQALGGAATSIFTLLLTRLGLGLFESAANPCAHKAIREWTPRSERGLATAIWYAGTNAGPALGSPLVAWLITYYGWRSAFVVTGALGLIWVVVWLFVYQPPEKARWITETERRKILDERDAATAQESAPSIGYRGLLTTTPTMWGLALTQGCINYTSYFFLAWLPIFLQSSYHLSVLETGAYTALPFGLSAVLSVVLSGVADRVLSAEALHQGKRRYAVALGSLASALIVATPYVGSIGFAMVVLTISLTCNTFAQSMNFALVNDRLRTAGDVGRAYAFFTLGGISFGIVGPIVTGYLVNMLGDFKIALVLCGGLAVVAAILVTALTRRAMGEKVGALAAPVASVPAA
ncbi:MFS transporter [Chelatococcus sp. GCM10030263]|uniref:MFS transporter n=1 Tax=Chelatococcus sp. GCM10030263 TaxID=3273387 RepID=UPI00361FB243